MYGTALSDRIQVGTTNRTGELTSAHRLLDVIPLIRVNYTASRVPSLTKDTHHRSMPPMVSNLTNRGSKILID
jgi:hypothetical protein